MLKKLVILLLLCLTVIIGGVYFILWPLAAQYLTAVSAVLQQSVGSLQEAVPALPPELSLDSLVSALPLLSQIGTETLVQLKGLADGGITAEEAEQALELLRRQLSAEQLEQLKAVFGIQQ